MYRDQILDTDLDLETYARTVQIHNFLPVCVLSFQHGEPSKSTCLWIFFLLGFGSGMYSCLLPISMSFTHQSIRDVILACKYRKQRTGIYKPNM